MSAPLDATLDIVRQIFARFTDPDDDVLPVVVLVTPSDIRVCVASFKDDEQKAVTFDVALPAFIVECKATAAIHVTTGWSVTRRPGNFPKNGASQEPDRKEVLVVAEVTAATSTVYLAPVLRTSNAPPTYGAFTSERAELRLLSACQAALADVAGG